MGDSLLVAGLAEVAAYPCKEVRQVRPSPAGTHPGCVVILRTTAQFNMPFGCGLALAEFAHPLRFVYWNTEFDFLAPR